MSTPVLFKVDIKKKKDPCRICNTKARPCIDLMKNSELLNAVTSSLGLMIYPETRLSKRICVVCMSLVRIFADFKRVCFATQNDLWKMEQNLVEDRGSEVVELLMKAKETVTPSSIGTVPQKHNIEFSHLDSSSGNLEQTRVTPHLNKRKQKINQDLTEMQESLSVKKVKFESPEFPTSNNIEFNESMVVEEHIEDIYFDEQNENPDLLQLMCTEDDCMATFDTKEEMDEHKAEVHGEPRQQYFCQVCKQTFNDIAGLVFHRKTNHFPKKCGFCSLIIPSESFIPHQSQCRKNKAKSMGILEPKKVGGKKKTEIITTSDIPLFKCGKCEASFRSIELYKQHYKMKKCTTS